MKLLPYMLGYNDILKFTERKLKPFINALIPRILSQAAFSKLSFHTNIILKTIVSSALQVEIQFFNIGMCDNSKKVDYHQIHLNIIIKYAITTGKFPGM